MRNLLMKTNSWQLDGREKSFVEFKNLETSFGIKSLEKKTNLRTRSRIRNQESTNE